MGGRLPLGVWSREKELLVKNRKCVQISLYSGGGASGGKGGFMRILKKGDSLVILLKEEKKVYVRGGGQEDFSEWEGRSPLRDEEGGDVWAQSRERQQSLTSAFPGSPWPFLLHFHRV